MGWWRKRMGVVLALGVSAMAMAEGEQAAPPQPITMPDVRANVMRMLEESRNKGDAGVSIEPTASSVTDKERRETPPPVTPVAEPTPLPPPAASTPATAPKPRQEAVAPRPPQPPAPSPRRDNHVPLEHKEVTIESLDDVRKLSEELKAAKRRHAGQKSPD